MGSSSRQHCRSLRGSELTDAEVAACAAVRRACVEIVHSDDAFDEQLRTSTHVTLVTVGEQLVGFTATHMRRTRWNGTRGWVIEGRYGFVLPAWRGRARYGRPTLASLARTWMRAPHLPVFFCGAAYPSSYARLGASLATPTCLHDSDRFDARAASLLQHLCEGPWANAYDPERRLVRLSTRPRPSEAHRRWTRDATARRVAHYETLNPLWRDGWALPMAIRLRLLPTALRWMWPTPPPARTRPGLRVPAATH